MKPTINQATWIKLSLVLSLVMPNTLYRAAAFAWAGIAQPSAQVQQSQAQVQQSQAQVLQAQAQVHQTETALRLVEVKLAHMTIGGLVGIAVGIAVSLAIPKLLVWPTLVSTMALVGSVMFSAAVGIFFGYHPARQAAALDPIEALWHE